MLSFSFPLCFLPFLGLLCLTITALLVLAYCVRIHHHTEFWGGACGWVSLLCAFFVGDLVGRYGQNGRYGERTKKSIN